MERGQVGILPHDEVDFRKRLIPRGGVADNRELVAGHVVPATRFVRLTGLDGLQHAGYVGHPPCAQTFVVLHAKTIARQLFVKSLRFPVGERIVISEAFLIGRADDGAHTVEYTEHARITGRELCRTRRVDVLRAAHDQIAAWFQHLPHEHVEADAGKGHFGRLRCLVGRNAMRDASMFRTRVHLDGLLDLIGLKPAHLCRIVERPRLGFVAIHLTGSAALLLDSVDHDGARIEHARIDR